MLCKIKLASDFADSLCSMSHSGQCESEQRPCTMYLYPADGVRCIVSMYTFANKGAGVATIGGITTCCLPKLAKSASQDEPGDVLSHPWPPVSFGKEGISRIKTMVARIVMCR